MSKRTGDRARFQKERKRKMLHRQRIQALVKSLAPPETAAAAEAKTAARR